MFCYKCGDIQSAYFLVSYKSILFTRNDKHNMIKLQTSDNIMMLVPGHLKKIFLLTVLVSTLSINSKAQAPDMTYMTNIKSARFHMYGNQQGLPIYTLNSSEQMELNFDDLDNDVKSYYYSLQSY